MMAMANPVEASYADAVAAPFGTVRNGIFERMTPGSEENAAMHRVSSAAKRS